MKKLIFLAGLLTLASTAHAQRAGAGAVANPYNSGGGAGGGGGFSSGGSATLGNTLPGPYSLPRANAAGTNTGEFVPTSYENYQDAVSAGQRELDAKRPQVAEAAREAQAMKKAGTQMPALVAIQDDAGNVVISTPRHGSNKN
jgi:hypothetical protein